MPKMRRPGPSSTTLPLRATSSKSFQYQTCAPRPAAAMPGPAPARCRDPRRAGRHGPCRALRRPKNQVGVEVVLPRVELLAENARRRPARRRSGEDDDAGSGQTRPGRSRPRARTSPPGRRRSSLPCGRGTSGQGADDHHDPIDRAFALLGGVSHTLRAHGEPRAMAVAQQQARQEEQCENSTITRAAASGAAERCSPSTSQPVTATST